VRRGQLVRLPVLHQHTVCRIGTPPTRIAT
jgi:hypothetical protein